MRLVIGCSIFLLMGCSGYRQANMNQVSLSSSESEDSINSVIDNEITEENNLDSPGSLQWFYAASPKNLVEVNRLRVGHICNPPNPELKASLSESSFPLKVDIYRRSAFLGDPLAARQFLDHGTASVIRNGREVEISDIATFIDEIWRIDQSGLSEPICSFSSEELNASLLSGEFRISEMLRENCAPELISEISSNAESELTTRVRELIVGSDLNRRQDYFKAFQEQNLPFHVRITSSATETNKPFIHAINVSIAVSSTGQVKTLLPDYLVEGATQFWEGFHTFVYNDQPGARCDYEEIIQRTPNSSGS